ncbi:MAG: GlcNAc-PI de-N-acetylase [Chloroflexi bacterium]|nr:GlcNAc-PI de-N-acetylase [Chloroflexota bacterium]|tara:strand:+ start:40 stop:762 length:723 start_codon:yes stop_codon:yes gene_type:complete
MDDQKENMIKKAMVVVAHPDDAEWGCSGSVARLCREGVEVVYVLCTDGSKGTEDRSIDGYKLSEIRKNEQIKAGEILGLKDVIFLNHPDGYLEATLDLRRDISREIRRWKPDLLITTNPKRDLMTSNYLGHPDHFAAGEAALSAVFPAARDHLTFPELISEGYDTHKVKEVWVMMFGENANYWYPISKEDVEKSVKSLHSHVSQVKNPDEASKWMKNRRSELGETIGADYAEGFRRYKLS